MREFCCYRWATPVGNASATRSRRQTMRIAATLLLDSLVSYSGLPGKKAPHGDELKIELRNLTERHSYSFKDFIVLDFVIINTGREPVGVFAKLGNGYQGGGTLHELGSEGAEI